MGMFWGHQETFSMTFIIEVKISRFKLKQRYKALDQSLEAMNIR